MIANPRVSVVVANYNYAGFLPEALDSVLGQTYQNIDLIVVDDGSDDGSRKILQAYDGRARILLQENRGVSAARNRGISAAKGELVAFLDSDDVWVPEKIERQVELFEDSEVGMVHTGFRYIDADGAARGAMLDGTRGDDVLEKLALLRNPGVLASGSSAVIRRSTIDTVGGFDESLSTSADWDMCRRIACHYRIDLVREPLVLYRQHGSAMHKNVGTMERDMLRAFEAMFADPAARAVHDRKRRCYGNLYLMLAGSYLHVGKVQDAIRCVVAGLVSWPPGIGYVLATPLRHLTGRSNAGFPPRPVGNPPRFPTASD